MWVREQHKKGAKGEERKNVRQGHLLKSIFIVQLEQQQQYYIHTHLYT